MAGMFLFSILQAATGRNRIIAPRPWREKRRRAGIPSTMDLVVACSGRDDPIVTACNWN